VHENSSIDSPLVYLIDDDKSVRTALVRLLKSAGYPARQFASGEAFLRECSTDPPGCLLLDLRLPTLSGLDLIETLVQRGSPFGVIVISGRGEIQDGVNAMKLGAVDFLTKPLDETQLLQRVAFALKLSCDRYLKKVEDAALWKRFETLTPRERQVCDLVSSGLLNKQVASQLGASEKTVKIHRARVMSKLSVHSVAELVRFVDRIKVRGRYRDPATMMPSELTMALHTSDVKTARSAARGRSY
jgi:FixJ family two-component response regulator